MMFATDVAIIKSWSQDLMNNVSFLHLMDILDSSLRLRPQHISPVLPGRPHEKNTVEKVITSFRSSDETAQNDFYYLSIIKTSAKC